LFACADEKPDDDINIEIIVTALIVSVLLIVILIIIIVYLVRRFHLTCTTCRRC